MLLEGNSNVCYPTYTNEIGIQLQRVILENVVPHVHRCVAKLRVGSRADITDSRRKCDKYNGGTRTDGVGSNPVGLENLSSVCRYYSRHPLLGRRIKRGSPPPSVSGLVSSSIWRSHVSRSVSLRAFCKLRKLRAGVASRRRAAKARRRLRIYSGTFDKSSRCCFG